MTEAVDEIFSAFPALPPTDGDDALLKAVLLVFPDVLDYSLIEEAQREGKSKFVQEGLMLGQFYPGCTTPGLRNKAFPALDAPLPILAVRNMVGSDFPFLAQRSEWVDAYLKKFAHQIPGPVRSQHHREGGRGIRRGQLSGPVDRTIRVWWGTDLDTYGHLRPARRRVHPLCDRCCDR